MTIEHMKGQRWGQVRGKSRSMNQLAHDGTEVREALLPEPGRRMTEAAFLRWIGEKTRAEWVEGEVTVMSPVSSEHDEISVWMLRLLAGFVEDRGLGRVCGSELMVRLPKSGGRRLPDVYFIAAAKLSGIGPSVYEGAPELIVEVVSLDSVARDYREKFNDYEASGVKEYWILDPLHKQTEVHELVRGKYRKITEVEGTIRSRVLKGLAFKPAWLWRKPLPRVSTLLREMGTA